MLQMISRALGTGDAPPHAQPPEQEKQPHDHINRCPLKYITSLYASSGLLYYLQASLPLNLAGFVLQETFISRTRLSRQWRHRRPKMQTLKPLLELHLHNEVHGVAFSR